MVAVGLDNIDEEGIQRIFALEKHSEEWLTERARRFTAGDGAYYFAGTPTDKQFLQRKYCPPSPPYLI